MNTSGTDTSAGFAGLGKTIRRPCEMRHLPTCSSPVVFGGDLLDRLAGG